MKRVLALSVCMSVGLVWCHDARATDPSHFCNLVLASNNKARVAAYDRDFLQFRIGVQQTSTAWQCHVLFDSPFQGGVHRYSGDVGLAMIEGSAGELLTAYSVSKDLFIQNPFACGVSDIANRRMLWLVKGTAVSTQTVVPIDTTGPAYFCTSRPAVGHSVRLARGGDGRVYALYYNKTDIRLAISDVGVTGFQAQTVVSQPIADPVGGSTSLDIAVDTGNSVHMLFRHYEAASGRQWYYATRSAAGVLSGPYLITLPDHPTGYGSLDLSTGALALSPGGTVHVVCGVSGQLWHLRHAGAGSFTDVVKVIELTVPGAIEGASLAVDGTSVAHVSYVMPVAGNGETRYASVNGQSVTTESIAPSPAPGARHLQTSLKLTSGTSVYPVIAYPGFSPEVANSTWLASRATGSWVVSEVVPCVVEGGGGSGGGGGEHDPYYDGVRARESTDEDLSQLKPQLVPSWSILDKRVQLRWSGLASEDTEAKLDIVDVAGRLILARRLNLTAGEGSMALDVGELARGVYFARLSTRNASGNAVLMPR